MKAAQRFDETRGFKFISYAVWWIRQAILQALAEQARIVRLPVNKIGSINRINRTFARLEQEFEREPSSQEIADNLEMVPEDVKEALKTNGRTVSMDAPIILKKITICMMFFRVMILQVLIKILLMNRLPYEIERALNTLVAQGSKGVEIIFRIRYEAPLYPRRNRGGAESYTGTGKADKGKSNQKNSVYHPLPDTEIVPWIIFCFYLCPKYL